MWLHDQEAPFLPKSQSLDRGHYTLVSKLYSSTRPLLSLVMIMAAEVKMLPGKDGQKQDRELFIASMLDENERLMGEQIVKMLMELQEDGEGLNKQQDGYVIQGDYIYFYKNFADINETLIYKIE